MSSKQKWGDLIDRSVLVSPADAPHGPLLEYIVRDVSPSGKNIKLENRGGRTFWCDSDEYDIIEVLKKLP